MQCLVPAENKARASEGEDRQREKDIMTTTEGESKDSCSDRCRRNSGGEGNMEDKKLERAEIDGQMRTGADGWHEESTYWCGEGEPRIYLRFARISDEMTNNVHEEEDAR